VESLVELFKGSSIDNMYKTEDYECQLQIPNIVKSQETYSSSHGYAENVMPEHLLVQEDAERRDAGQLT